MGEADHEKKFESPGSGPDRPGPAPWRLASPGPSPGPADPPRAPDLPVLVRLLAGAPSSFRLPAPDPRPSPASRRGTTAVPAGALRPGQSPLSPLPDLRSVRGPLRDPGSGLP